MLVYRQNRNTVDVPEENPQVQPSAQNTWDAAVTVATLARGKEPPRPRQD